MLQMLLQLPYAPLQRASLPLNLRGFDMLVKDSIPCLSMSYFLFSSETLSQHGVTGVYYKDFKILKVVPNVCDFLKH